MKYYKLKTVAFYIFIATIMSFDLKGSENEDEGSCTCCNCWNNKENKEEKKPEVVNKEKKLEGENKDEEEKKERRRREKIRRRKINKGGNVFYGDV